MALLFPTVDRPSLWVSGLCTAIIDMRETKKRKERKDELVVYGG